MYFLSRYTAVSSFIITQCRNITFITNNHLSLRNHGISGCRFEGRHHFIASDEGNDLGGTIGKALNDCESFCKQTAGCKSFSYCNQQKVCRLKDKLPIGSQIESDSCTSFYLNCNSGMLCSNVLFLQSFQTYIKEMFKK